MYAMFEIIQMHKIFGCYHFHLQFSLRFETIVILQISSVYSHVNLYTKVAQIGGRKKMEELTSYRAILTQG